MIRHVLVPLDGSAVAESVIPHTVAIASAFDARLTLLQVVEQAGASQSVDPLDWHITKTAASSYLERIERRLREDGLVAEKVLLEGQVAPQIVDFAREHDVDLLAMCTHGK